MPSRKKTSLLRRGVTALLRAITGHPLAGANAAVRTLDLASLERVLLVRHDRIGDAVISTPVLDALRAMAPSATIDVLASPGNAVVFCGDPRVAETIVWPGSIIGRARAILHARRNHYDAVLQLVFNQTTLPSLIACLMAPRGLVVGKRGNDRSDLMDISVMLPQEHFADRTLALVYAAAGLPFPEVPARYALGISEAHHQEAAARLTAAGLQPGRFIMLNISSGGPRRELTPEQNTEIALALIRRGWTVGVMGRPDAGEKIAAVAAASGAHAVEFPSLLVAAAAIERAAMVVTPDTSIVHVACAVGTPVVALYPSDGHLEGWGPRGVPYRTLRAPEARTATLDVRAVIDAADDLLAELSATPRN